jgi:hypothetical protein
LNKKTLTKLLLIKVKSEKEINTFVLRTA